MSRDATPTWKAGGPLAVAPGVVPRSDVLPGSGCCATAAPGTAKPRINPSHHDAPCFVLSFACRWSCVCIIVVRHPPTESRSSSIKQLSNNNHVNLIFADPPCESTPTFMQGPWETQEKSVKQARTLASTAGLCRIPPPIHGKHVSITVFSVAKAALILGLLAGALRRPERMLNAASPRPISSPSGSIPYTVVSRSCGIVRGASPARRPENGTSDGGVEDCVEASVHGG